MGWRYHNPPPLFKQEPKVDVPEFPPEVPLWLHGETQRFYRAWEPTVGDWKGKAWGWASLAAFLTVTLAPMVWLRIPAGILLVAGVMETSHRRGHWNGFRRGFLGGRMDLRPKE